MTADPGETPTGTADARMAVDLTAAPKVAAADVPPQLAATVAGFNLVFSGLDIVEVRSVAEAVSAAFSTPIRSGALIKEAGVTVS